MWMSSDRFLFICLFPSIFGSLPLSEEGPMKLSQSVCQYVTRTVGQYVSGSVVSFSQKRLLECFRNFT